MTNEVHEISYCVECLDELVERGAYPVNLYLEICSQYVLGNPVYISKYLNAIATFLKCCGYIDLKEIENNCFVAKPLGYTKVNECEHDICAFRHEHK